jgi:hypothetical protein
VVYQTGTIHCFGMLHVEDMVGFFHVDNMCGKQNSVCSELEKHIDILEVNHTITSSVARFNESVVKFR